jgi:sugar phosphate isomerase/epimerase
MSSRRNFLRNAALGAGAAALYPTLSHGAAAMASPSAKGGFTIGFADYTFRSFSIPESIKLMQQLGVQALSVKDFHMPLNSTQQQINDVMAQYKAGGIHVYAVGVIYMKSAQDVDRAFDYARMAGVPLIIGVPEYDLLDYTEKKVKEFNIRIAIHNHGPQDKLYPGPREVYNKISGRDPRMGLCLDIGHSERAGEEPAAAVAKYGKRIYDMHIKDVTKAENDGQAIPVGRGVIDFQKLVKALRKANYQGHCSLEYEKSEKVKTDEIPGMSESVGYFSGVSKTIL